VVDDLVAELHTTLCDLDLAVPAAPEDTGVLAEIDEAIAPTRLPPSARRLWQLVDPWSLQQTVSLHPMLMRPDFALSSWRLQEDAVTMPRHFFPLCYDSHDFLSIECDGPDWTGGALFEWFVSDYGGRFALRYRGVEDWLSTLTTALRSGEYRRVNNSHVMIETELARQRARERLVAGATVPGYGAAYEFDAVGIPAEWPSIWQERSSIPRRVDPSENASA
jgi:hypothetical protein